MMTDSLQTSLSNFYFRIKSNTNPLVVDRSCKIFGKYIALLLYEKSLSTYAIRNNEYY